MVRAAEAAFAAVAKSFSSLAGLAGRLNPPARTTKPTFVGYPIIFLIFIIVIAHSHCGKDSGRLALGERILFWPIRRQHSAPRRPSDRATARAPAPTPP